MSPGYSPPSTYVQASNACHSRLAWRSLSRPARQRTTPITVEVFTEARNQGRLETWQLELLRGAGGRDWRIQDQTAVDTVDGLFHLELNPTIQYDADNLVISGEDISLTLAEGSIFVAETPDGVTGVVLLGNGTLNFTPEPEAE